MATNRCNHTKLRRRLLGWYRREQRELPWRIAIGQTGRPAPYHVLVSETMLQQTQVATAIPYFLRFIAQFPTVQTLATSPQQQVLRLWQGLGYYARARNLHAAAKMIMDQFAGHVPKRTEDLLLLPGIGRYTAGAIASIAFGKAEPVLDGNVGRVLTRLWAISQPLQAPKTQRRLWALASQLVPQHHAGDFNQALMELGATVCTPTSPDCTRCPLISLCRAHSSNRIASIPRRLPRQSPRPAQHLVLAIKRYGKFLFQQRPDRGLWSAMWQLPTAETLNGQSPVQWSWQTLGLKVNQPQELGSFTHRITHRTIQFVVHRAQARRGVITSGLWRCLDEVDDLPLAKPQQLALALVRQHEPK